MCKGIESLKQFAADKNIKISGLNKIPEMVVQAHEFENPFDNGDDNIYADDTKYVTYAKMPDGRLHTLAMVSDQYEMLQHYDALHLTLDRILKEVPEYGVPEVQAMFSDNGGRMFAKMKFPKTYEIGKDDPIQVQSTLINSGDTTRRYYMSLEALRQICTNGLMAPDNRWPHNKQIKQLHKGGSLDIQDALDGMVKSFVGYSEAIGLWKEYANIQIEKEQYGELLDASGFSKKMVENVLSLPLRGFDTPLESDFVGNKKAVGWKAYNAATQFITDNVENQLTAIDRGTRLTKSFDKLI